MKKSLQTVVATMVCLTVSFWSMTGRAGPDPQVPQQEGVATKAAEKLDEVGRAIKRGFLNAEESVREGLNKTGETVPKASPKREIRFRVWEFPPAFTGACTGTRNSITFHSS